MFLSGYQRKGKSSRGFTLVEIVFVVLMLGLVMSYSCIEMQRARQDALEMLATANVQTLNQASERARLRGDVGSGTYGSDPDAAMTWYVQRGYIRQPVSLFGVTYVSGRWELDLPW